MQKMQPGLFQNPAHMRADSGRVTQFILAPLLHRQLRDNPQNTYVTLRRQRDAGTQQILLQHQQ